MDSRIRSWIPRLRVAALAVVGAVALFAVVGYLAIPRLARWGVEAAAARELGRAIHVQEISANPFTLSVTLRGLVIDGLAGEPVPLATIRELSADASVASLIRRAPVLDALVVDGLTANLVRLDEQQFNFSGIIERIRAKPKSDEPAWFSISNIEVTNSTVNFEDRPTGKRHALNDIRLGIPFISNLPIDLNIKVEPAFAARLNGAPIEARGETAPFLDTLESSLNVRLNGIDIPTYLAYSPLRLNFTIARGALTADLRIAFRRAAPAQRERPAQSAQLLVSGLVEVAAFELAAPAEQAQRLIQWRSLRVVLDEVEPLAGRVVIGDVALEAPVVEAVRDAAGALNWSRVAQAPVQAAATPTSAPSDAAGKPAARSITLKHASLKNGTINAVDDSVGHFQLQVVNLSAEASGVATTTGTRGKVRANADIGEASGSVSLEGEVALAPIAGRLAIAGRDVKLRAVARYLAQVINATLDGSSDTDGVLEFSLEPETVAVLRDVRWTGKDIKVRGPTGSGADFDLERVTMDGSEIDLMKSTITIGKLALEAPRTTVRRLADGRINWTTAFRAQPTAAAAQAKPAAEESAGWHVLLKELTVTKGDVRLEDMAVDPAVKLRASAIEGSIRNAASDGKTPADIDLRTRFGSGGTLAAKGSARRVPVAAELQFDARNLDISALRPYVAARLNAVLARAELSGRGRLTATQSAAEVPLVIGYRGNLRLDNLHLLDGNGEIDLLRWQQLELQQVAATVGKETPDVSVGKVALSDFYARVIVSAQGRLNLVDLMRREGEAAKPALATATPTALEAQPGATPPDERAATAPETPSAAAAPDATRADAASRGALPIIRIGQIDLVRGNVNFTDNFIKPNYTANMIGLGGTVTTLASDSAEPATMTIAGMIDNEAPVDISGRLNPLAPKLFLDIEGRTKGVDLPRLTPYSVKYAGYPIVKGKLSMEVKYKVEDGKLAANNHLFLDQLTFGDKVDSPSATKLPVLLAVSLLKNSRGEIDLNLPISGTLNDPKFSVGGVIIQVIVNLLTKVVTAPFTLLAAAFGGSGEELGFVEFAAGSATLSAEQLKRVDTLSKALDDRPALRLDIIGRVDPALDTEGVKHAKLENRLRAAKVRQTVRASGEAVDPATVNITAEERPKLIEAVYSSDDIPNKPRNAVGFAKSIPAVEMEPLILASLAVTPEDLRALANQRASTVRDRLETDGKVARDRLFLVEPKINANGIKDKGATTRVDFSLK